MRSVWEAGAELPHFDALSGDRRTDVLIIGGGIAGVLCAYRLAEAGVKGIWNFSNQELSLPDFPDVVIENMHMGDSLMMLCYAMKEKEEGR